jgi:hypothetical protein
VATNQGQGVYFQIGKFALGAAIGLSLILIGFVLMNNGGRDDSPPTAMSVLSAMQVTIDAYQCHRSENKHIIGQQKHCLLLFFFLF